MNYQLLGKTGVQVSSLCFGSMSFGDIADEQENVHPVSLAIAWVAAHEGVTAPIIGARNTTQLQPALDALDIDMNTDLYERISALSPAPAVATDRNEETEGVFYKGKK